MIQSETQRHTVWASPGGRKCHSLMQWAYFCQEKMKRWLWSQMLLPCKVSWSGNSLLTSLRGIASLCRPFITPVNRFCGHRVNWMRSGPGIKERKASRKHPNKSLFFQLFWNLSDFSFTMDEWTSACMKRERTAEDKAAAETFTAVLSRGVWADPVS